MAGIVAVEGHRNVTTLLLLPAAAGRRGIHVLHLGAGVGVAAHLGGCARVGAALRVAIARREVRGVDDLSCQAYRPQLMSEPTTMPSAKCG